MVEPDNWQRDFTATLCVVSFGNPEPLGRLPLTARLNCASGDHFKVDINLMEGLPTFLTPSGTNISFWIKTWEIRSVQELVALMRLLSWLLCGSHQFSSTIFTHVSLMREERKALSSCWVNPQQASHLLKIQGKYILDSIYLCSNFLKYLTTVHCCHSSWILERKWYWTVVSKPGVSVSSGSLSTIQALACWIRNFRGWAWLSDFEHAL